MMWFDQAPDASNYATSGETPRLHPLVTQSPTPHKSSNGGRVPCAVIVWLLSQFAHLPRLVAVRSRSLHHPNLCLFEMYIPAAIPANGIICNGKKTASNGVRPAPLSAYHRHTSAVSVSPCQSANGPKRLRRRRAVVILAIIKMQLRVTIIIIVSDAAGPLASSRLGPLSGLPS
jgi:hypothetical protein